MTIRLRSGHLVAGFFLGLVACQRSAPVIQASDPRPLLEAFMSAWNRHDAASLDTLVAANAVHEDLAFGFRGIGPEGFKGYLGESIRQVPDFDWRTTAVFVEGPVVAAEWTLAGTFTGDTPTGPVAGRRFSVRGASILVTEGGRIVRFSDYYNAAELFRQLAADSTAK